jgi:hypothetical protein
LLLLVTSQHTLSHPPNHPTIEKQILSQTQMGWKLT